MQFYIIDAFAEQLFGGNPAGVVIVEEEFSSDEVMIKTAAELRYSETAFVKRIDETTFMLRYFTPAAEVDLCGHATIASFFALNQMGWVKSAHNYTAVTKAGQIDVSIDGHTIWMDMAKPQIFRQIDQVDELNKLYQVMGLNAPSKSLPSIVSTGLKDILLPVDSIEQLNQITPDYAALSDLSREYDVVGVHAFTLNQSKKIHARNFAPLYDIDEEAATGTSNGALAYYLYHKKLLELGEDITIIQGEAMKRPSQIFARVELKDNAPNVKVGGTAMLLAKGDIKL